MQFIYYMQQNSAISVEVVPDCRSKSAQSTDFLSEIEWTREKKKEKCLKWGKSSLGWTTNSQFTRFFYVPRIYDYGAGMMNLYFLVVLCSCSACLPIRDACNRTVLTRNVHKQRTLFLICTTTESAMQTYMARSRAHIWPMHLPWTKNA